MTRHSLPTRALSDRPDRDQLKRQAKELLDAFRAGEPDAVAEVTAHYRDPDKATFALHDAHLVIARAYGFESWPKLKAYVEGATDRRLIAAVRARDLQQVRAMLQARPELSGRSGALHVAVLERAPELVHVLMQHGANARVGIYPHRDATSPLTIATERGYDDIIAIMREEEQRRQHAERGVEQRPRGGAGQTSLDAAAYWSGLSVEEGGSAHEFAAVADLLLKDGAELTARAAVALGNAEWLRARRAEGTLINRIEEAGGLLRIAVSHNRSEILALLLEFGFDPDERTRFRDVSGDEVVFIWGMPLWHCAASGKYGMAEMLLASGADPNADVYASGTPLNQAYGRRDRAMVELLEQHGGRLDAGAVGLYRLTDRAEQMLADATGAPSDEVGRAVGEHMLWGGACGGDPEIVRMALAHVDWPRDDPRWFSILEQPLRIWNHGLRFWANNGWDRGTYLTCFRLVLERCDANLRGRLTEGQPFGLTILHSVAGSREHVTAEERVAFATMLLDAGARLDVRDYILKSTPVAWACRWGRAELVKLYLERGADPVEPDAEPWATPLAWAKKKGHSQIEEHLRRAGAR